ncbi:MAG TPA: rod-binding protein [Pseudidiomarina sp.]|nr:rod-binding protein [Pseudidiomarina sp.]
MSSIPGLAFDSQQLNDLKTASSKRPEQAAEAAVKQFEALFVGHMMKSMRAASGDSVFFNSNAMKTYNEMFDAQLSSELASKGIGLADTLLQQLQKTPNK